MYGQSSTCKVVLKAEKDRNSRSTTQTGTYYKMIITNSGESKNTFELSYVNINSNCSNEDGTSTASNIDLNLEFLDLNLSPLYQLSLNKGETITFLAHVIVPNGTIPNKWCCSKVIAKSNNCSNYSIDSVLHTLLVSSEE